MRRYQVAADGDAWTNRGPDLLRKRAGAVARVLSLCGRRGEYVGRTLRAHAGGAAWDLIGRRRNLEPWITNALEAAASGDRVQVGVRPWEEVTIRAVVRTREIEVEALEGSSAGVSIANALFVEAFPASLFGGAFVCKQIAGSSSWSDHSWGDALDRTSSATAPNDALTDWAARMAASGDMPAAYLLGSRAGRVVEAKPRLVGSWALMPSSAASSHLWHVHLSVRDHGGARPPCA